MVELYLKGDTNMKKGRIALAALLATTVAVSSVSIVGFAANNSAVKIKQEHVAIKADANPSKDYSKKLFQLNNSVQNVKVAKSAANLISLSWNKVENAAGYYVYTCDKENSDNYVLFADIKKPTVDIMDLKSASPYWFKVSAYKECDGSVYESKPVVIKTATKADDVTNLGSERSSDVLKFSWKPLNKVTGYDIYRSCKKTNSKYELYQSLGSDAASFEDKDVKKGELYSYKVVPYRTIEGVKYEANGKVIDLVSGLSAPGNLIARSANTRVTLHWDEKDQASGYNIYMATSEKGEYKKIGSTSENSYATDKLKAGTTYWFRVQPYKKLSGGKVAQGTWSSCKIKAAKAEESTRSAPKSQISGKGTYIEVSIAQQHMWFYEKGKLVLDTDVVTGNDDGSCNTPTGNFTITSRATNTTLTGPGYSSFVNYWMGFYGGCGVHDASWRSSFGGDIYKGNGSHGCVNTPYAKVKTIYERTEMGTPIYVY